MNKYLANHNNKILIILFIIVYQTYVTSPLQATERLITTHYGNYVSRIPELKLPEISRFSLVRIMPLTLPALPDWKSSRFIPEEPSWLDRGGKLYQEGISAYYKGKIGLALKGFSEIEKSHPDTPWYIPTLFWLGHLQALQGNYQAALEKLVNFESESAKVQFPLRSDFRNRASFTRIWMALKQNWVGSQTLQLLRQALDEISDSSIRLRLYELQLAALQKAGQHNKAIAILRGIQSKFSGSGEPLIWLAEVYFRNHSWEALAGLVKNRLSGYESFQAPTLEKLLLMGIEAEIQLGRFDRASSWVERLQEDTLVNQDLPLLARIRVHQRQKDYSSLEENWENMTDSALRSLVLREIFRVAEEDRQYDFLVNFEFDKIFWRSWEAEGQLIRAQALRMLGQREEAYRIYQIAYTLAGDHQYLREMALYQRTLIELEVHDLEKTKDHLVELLGTYTESPYRSEYNFWYALVLHEKGTDSIASLMALRQIDISGERADDSLYLQGRINLEHANWSQASKAFARLKTQHPESPYLEEGLQYLAEAYYEQKQYVIAQATLTELRQKFHPLQDPVAVIHLQARNLVALGDLNKANALLRKDLKIHPDFSLIQLHLHVLEKLQDQRGILEVTQLGLNLSVTENQSYLHFHQANALFKTERLAKAYVHYEHALLNPPVGQDAFIRFRLIKIHYLLREYEDFESKAEVYVEVEKKGDYANEILQLLGNHHFAMQLPEKAIHYRERLVKNLMHAVRSPELASLRRLELVTCIGELYNTMNLHESAEQWLNQALGLMEDFPDEKGKYHLRILREKGLAAYKQGKHRRALSADLKVAYLDKTLPLGKKYELNLRIASSYQQLKRIREAKSIYQKMLKKFQKGEWQLEIKRRMKLLKQEGI